MEELFLYFLINLIKVLKTSKRSRILDSLFLINLVTCYISRNEHGITSSNLMIAQQVILFKDE